MITKSLILAIMLTESSFNPAAMSPKGAQGLLQLMPIAVKEVSTVYKLPGNADMFDPDHNILYGILLLNHYAAQTRSTDELLAMYHGGYRQLSYLRNGRPLAKETSIYIRKVRDRFTSYDNGFTCRGAELWSSRVYDALKRSRQLLRERNQGFRFERSWWSSELREAIRHPSDGVH